MPRIKPFRGVYPRQDIAEKLIVDAEDVTIEDAKRIRDRNPVSFVHMLVPKLQKASGVKSKTEIAYQAINENFLDFLEKRYLLKDEKPCLYVYQVETRDWIHQGLWAVTSVDDYLSGKLKKHEFTLPQREEKLIEYLNFSGIDANPVLLIYPHQARIKQILGKTVAGNPFLNFSSDQSIHKLWKIDEEQILEELISLIEGLKNVYIADGHHRVAAASKYALSQRSGQKRTDEEYNYFSSVYMATDEVKIFEYNRFLKDLGGLSPESFLLKPQSDFTIRTLPEKSSIKPQKLHEFGMYLAERSYRISLKQERGPEELDVSILEELILKPILNILDSRNDARVNYLSGEMTDEEIMRTVDDGEYAVAFTVFPVSVEQLTKFIDRGGIMPPKSTRFEPKFKLGLLIHLLK